MNGRFYITIDNLLSLKAFFEDTLGVDFIKNSLPLPPTKTRTIEEYYRALDKQHPLAPLWNSIPAYIENFSKTGNKNLSKDTVLFIELATHLKIIQCASDISLHAFEVEITSSLFSVIFRFFEKRQ